MSNTVDNRILEMQFNNKQFESGIQTSIKSLGQLEKGLQLKGAANGLAELDRATKSFSLGHLANSVDFIAGKFSALGIMGVTAMQNIANSAYHTAERMVKSLTTEPIKAGFSEYETQINSIQTILANTQKDGTTLTDVTGALDELNAYADKTIYNFTEMTRNIGTFTAAGVKLDTATNAIQGIANLAAISGSNSQQASTAMYQLSQAMASGTVKLMDWNSVVNAGMGGQVFQDALKETAKVHGVNIDAMIKKHGSFRETLTEGWITTDVLTETLEKFTATTENLTEEQIKANREMWKSRGYTEEQIDAIFEMGKTATDAATKVKTFTQLFDTLKEAAQSGWTQSWEIIVGDFEEAKSLLTDISNAVGDIINTSASTRNWVLSGWKELGGRDDLVSGFKNIGNAIMDVMKIADSAREAIFPHKRFLGMTVADLVKITNDFDNFTASLRVSDSIAPRLSRVFKGFFAILDIGKQLISATASGFAKMLGSAAPIGNNLLDMAASLGDFLVELSNTTRETGIFNVAIDKIGEAIDFVAGMFGKLTSKGAELFKFFEGIDLSGIEIKIEPLKALAEAGAWAMEKLQAAYDKALPFLTTFGSYVANAFGGFSSAVSGAVQDGTISELATGGMFAALVVGITKVTKALADIGDNVGGILENLSGIFEGVTGALEGMQNKLNAEALKNIAIAVAILAGSLVALSLANPYNLGAAIGSITMMFVELTTALFAVTEIASGAKMMKVTAAAKAMTGIAIAILALAGAMAIIGTMDSGSVLNGMIAIISLMGMLTLVVQKLGNGSIQMMKGASSLIAFALAIGVLALSLKMLGSMDFGALAAGLAALGGILLELGAFLALSDLSSVSISAGVGLMGVAAAILILSASMFILGSMDLEKVAQGFVIMAVSLGMLLMATEVLPSNLISAGVGLMAIASSLLIVSAALLIMGNLKLETAATGLIVMAVALTELVVAANLMKGSIGGAAAILIMSTALIALGAALKIIGSMSAGDAVQSLVTLAGALAIIGIAAAVLAPVTPLILALSGALAAFSAAAAIFGVALIAIGAGLTAIGTGISALVIGIIASITTIVGAIPVLAEQIGATIVAIADAIAAAAPACGEAISAVIQTIVDIIVNGVASISEAVGGAGSAISTLAEILLVLGAASVVLAPLIPAIISLTGALTAFGLGCVAIAAGVTLLAGALALLGKSGLIVADAMADIYNTINNMGDLSLDAVTSSAKTFKSAGEKAADMIIKGLNSKISAAGEAMNALVTAMADKATSGSSKFSDIGKSMISVLINGVNSKKSAAVTAISDVGSSMTSALSGCEGSFYNIGTNVVQGLINGINFKKSSAVSAARALAAAVEDAAKGSLDVNSPSGVFEDIGMFVDMGLANGLIKFAKLATNAATQLGQNTIQPVMTMTDNMLSDLGSMSSALRGTAAMASSLDSSITSEQYVTVNHTFGDLTVKGVNDRNEFVAVANYSVEEMMTELMRKGIRR